jgi:hypothetical protein
MNTSLRIFLAQPTVSRLGRRLAGLALLALLVLLLRPATPGPASAPPTTAGFITLVR